MTRLRKPSRGVARRWSVCVCAASRRALKRRCARVRHAKYIHANWTESKRHTWWRWPAARHPKVVIAGRCASWPTSWWNWRSWTTSRTKRCGGRLKKRTQAVVEATVLPAGGAERRVRLPHGGRLGRLYAAVRPAATGGVFGRDQRAVGRRNAHVAADGARPASPVRLRI